jgi:DNA adenine methylase
MTDTEHEQLSKVLHSVRGSVALSGYRCPLTDRLYGDWHRVDADSRLCNSSKGERTESLWTNYNSAAAPFPKTVDAAGNSYLLDRKVQKSAHRNGSKK